ncbi:MAG TPA: Rnf-Nqr domain containing protein [Spirochaetia bacterium]|nr:Rnf-Nqr domain containing protein [Spirochaetia bacterium]
MTRRPVFRDGVLRDNPVAVMLVGLCPAAAVTSRVIDAAWMSVGLFFVLLLTRLCQAILHALRAPDLSEPPAPGAPPQTSVFPLRPRWLGSLLLSSCFTAAFELILLAFAPSESASLGIYVPLLAVNCLVLERFQRSGPEDEPESPVRVIARSLREAAGLGAGFAICLVAISLVREILGSGTITLFAAGSFGGTIEVGGLSSVPVRALTYGGGGLLCLGYLAGFARLLGRRKRRSGATEAGRS